MSSGKGFFYAPQFARPMKDYTVGYAKVDWEEWPEPETRQAFAAALDVIRGLGVKLKEVELPDYPYGPLVSTIIQGEASSIFEELISSGKVDQIADAKQASGLKAAGELTAKDYLKAMRVRSLLQIAFREFFYELDMVIAPTRMGVASGIDAALDAPRATAPAERKRGMSAHIPAGNLAGLPALSLPCGFAGGLPVGITLMGRAFTENALLAVGNSFQQKTDWHKKRPAV
ncbi:MAG: amidase family protein [Acidobacteria bacterium]|nr:amidase family protein [Acidobacteriota bacterium]